MTTEQQLADANRRLETARDYYRRNQAEIANLKAVIGEVASVVMTGERGANAPDHPAIEAVVDHLGDFNRSHTLANKYRQWCRMTLQASQRAEFSHLLNDGAWEVLLSGIEADLANEDEQPPF